jgi:CRP/FNR family cyclic AMP-dependent transcriptional regulator
MMVDARADALASNGWLSLQTAAFRHAVLAEGQVRHFSRGDTVFLQGDPPGGVFGIIAGSVAVRIAPGPTGPHLGHIASPGAWFGEGGFLTGEPRRVTLEAATDAVLFHLPLDAMERLATTHAGRERRFARLAMLNIDLALRVIDDLLIPQADRRVAASLLRCLPDPGRGVLHLSQAELGQIANASRKVVNRTLAAFEDRGWVTRGSSTIEIADAGALRRFATDEAG